MPSTTPERIPSPNTISLYRILLSLTSPIALLGLISVPLLLNGCSVTPNFQSEQSITPQANTIIYNPANPTITPTPFQPIPPTPAFIPTQYARPGLSPTLNTSQTWGSYPGPSVNPPLAIPSPVGIIDQPENQINILIMGSDQRPYEGGYRTDVLLLLTLNPDNGTATLTSFPRDLFVYIPGWTMERINTAQARGGFELTAQTFEYNFGVRPDYWVLINFTGFILLINSLGGIDVLASQTLTDTRDGYGYYTVPAGSIHMDGDTALWYARSRGSSSDFDRTRRAQEIIQAIFFRVISLDGVARAPELYQQYDSTMTTNLTLENILPLLPLATQLAASSNIIRYAIGSSHVTPWVNPYNGAQVLLPNREAILDIMKQALGAP